MNTRAAIAAVTPLTNPRLSEVDWPAVDRALGLGAAGEARWQRVAASYRAILEDVDVRQSRHLRAVMREHGYGGMSVTAALDDIEADHLMRQQP